MSKEIDDALGIESLPQPTSKRPNTILNDDMSIIPNEQDPVKKDLDFVRKNYLDVIETGNEALIEMVMLAKSSEHPRAFEVVATLMKTILDANKDLVTLHKDKKAMEKKEDGPQTQNITNNNMLISKEDLMKQVLEKMEDKSNDK